MCEVAFLNSGAQGRKTGRWYGWEEPTEEYKDDKPGSQACPDSPVESQDTRIKQCCLAKEAAEKRREPGAVDQQQQSHSGEEGRSRGLKPLSC